MDIKLVRIDCSKSWGPFRPFGRLITIIITNAENDGLVIDDGVVRNAGYVNINNVLGGNGVHVDCATTLDNESGRALAIFGVWDPAKWALNNKGGYHHKIQWALNNFSQCCNTFSECK